MLAIVSYDTVVVLVVDPLKQLQNTCCWGGGTLYVLTFTIATIISSHHDQSSNSNKAGNREIEIKRKIRMVSVREEPMSQTNFSVA